MSRRNREFAGGAARAGRTPAEGVVTVAGENRMPPGLLPRRMSVATLAGGRSAICSALPLDKPGMARIERLGQPALAIVPDIARRLDERAGPARFPSMMGPCPPRARHGGGEGYGRNVGHWHRPGAQVMARQVAFAVRRPRVSLTRAAQDLR